MIVNYQLNPKGKDLQKEFLCGRCNGKADKNSQHDRRESVKVQSKFFRHTISVRPLVGWLNGWLVGWLVGHTE